GRRDEHPAVVPSPGPRGHRAQRAENDQEEFSQHVERTKQRYKRIAVDSMTALKMFSMEGQDSRILIQSFLRLLAELEATTLIVSERLDRKKLETEFFLGRVEIRMHKWIHGSMIRRAV